MAPALLRDSVVGDIIYHLSGYRLFQHPEDKASFTVSASPHSANSDIGEPPSCPDYDISAVIARPDDEESRLPLPHTDSDQQTIVAQETSKDTTQEKQKAAEVERGDLAREKEKESVQEEIAHSFIVVWAKHDPENPQNWSLRKKLFVAFQIYLLTFSTYIGSSIYSPGIDQVAQQFGISTVAASLGITMFVAGYGVGPMFLSPLSEIPQLGRTNIYIASLALFVVLQAPTAVSKNLGALLPLRFFAGVAGSPALATGGASLADMFAPEYHGIVIGFWVVAATSAPALGPVIGGFATMSEGWTWTIWILLWLGGATLVFSSLLLPETSHAALLYRRAVRLRRVSRDKRFKSEGEIETEHLTVSEVVKMSLVRPLVLMFIEPIVIFWNIYITLVYGVLYIFIESFNVVFIEHHGFNLGENGLAYLGISLGALIAYLCFVPYALRVEKPHLLNGTFVPETRLPVAMVASFVLPISLFWFGWTSQASVHWIVPIIASTFYATTIFMLFQSGLSYLSDCYPRYSASVMASNTFMRAMVGAAFPLFSTAFFHNLGVGPACSILGGIAVLMLPVPWLLYRYGARVRSWSKYAG